MTKPRRQTWGNDPVLYAQEMNAWLDADDAAREAAFIEQFDPAEIVEWDEWVEKHLAPRQTIGRAVDRLKELPVRSRRAVSIRFAIQKLVAGNDDLYRFAERLLRAKCGPGNKSSRPRKPVNPSILEGDPWAKHVRPAELDEYAKIREQHDAEFIADFARDAVAIYRRIKRRLHPELHFRRSPHDGLPDDMEIAVDRVLRPLTDARMYPDDVATAAQRRAGEEWHQDFRAKVAKAARSINRGDRPGRRRPDRQKGGTSPARKKKAPKASASGAR